MWKRIIAIVVSILTAFGLLKWLRARRVHAPVETHDDLRKVA